MGQIRKLLYVIFKEEIFDIDKNFTGFRCKQGLEVINYIFNNIQQCNSMIMADKIIIELYS